jgi:hypothetical protein
VVHDGKRIEAVKHVGRKLPAELRTRSSWAIPPASGAWSVSTAARPTASSATTSIRWPTGDHQLRQPGRALLGVHQRKTEADRRAGLLGSNAKGKREQSSKRSDEGQRKRDGSEREPP